MEMMYTIISIIGIILIAYLLYLLYYFIKAGADIAFIDMHGFTGHNYRWMKFLYWKKDLAWFRKATWWEILRMKIREIYTDKPDPNNLILYIPPGTEWGKRTPHKYYHHKTKIKGDMHAKN